MIFSEQDTEIYTLSLHDALPIYYIPTASPSHGWPLALGSFPTSRPPRR